MHGCFHVWFSQAACMSCCSPLETPDNICCYSVIPKLLPRVLYCLSQPAFVYIVHNYLFMKEVITI